MATGENWEREGPSTRMVFSSMIVRPSPPTGAPVKREAAAHAVDQDEKHAQAGEDVRHERLAWCRTRD
eukprot:7335282-Prymnesium_polylepis.1